MDDREPDAESVAPADDDCRSAVPPPERRTRHSHADMFRASIGKAVDLDPLSVSRTLHEQPRRLKMDDRETVPEASSPADESMNGSDTPSVPRVKRRTHAEIFRNIIGKAEGLPADLARNHDHYLHGKPKK